MFFDITQPSSWSCCFNLFSGGDEEEEVDDLTHLERLLGDCSELMGQTNPLVIPDSSSSEDSNEEDEYLMEYNSDGYEEEYIPVPERPENEN
jgi:hypothetical protein